MMPTLFPLGDQVLVRRRKQDEQVTDAGFVLVGEDREAPEQGDVLAVGPGARSDRTGARKALAVDVGDRVLFSRYAGTEVTVGGEELTIMHEGEIFAVADPDVTITWA
jgi:chaperonin GroES